MRLDIAILFLLAALTLNTSITKANGASDFFRELVDELAKEDAKQKDPNHRPISTLQGPIPLGDQKGAIPPECHPQEFQRKALADYENPNQYSLLIRSYFNKCSKYLTEGNSKGIPALLKFAMTEYDLSKNPLINKQELILSDGTKVEAYIGVKDLATPRPWVIVKCGVFCDISSSASTLNYVINFFDQSPFNVIFLSNHTGNTHIKLNSALTIGGFYEVHDFYDVGHWLKYQSPYQITVDSIHAAGVSLGGSAAMAVSHLSSLYRSSDGRPIFNSTIAICPVVNLGPTLKDMYADTIKGKLFTRLTWKYLQDAAPYLNDAKDYLAQKNPPSSEKFPLMLSDIVLRYGLRWEHSNPPGRNSATSPGTITELMSLNHFSENSRQLLVPTLAWASHDDHVVNFELNTKTLIDSSDQVPEQGAVGVDFGDHCGFDTTYGFSATTAVLQSFILNNSPNFKAQRQTRSIMFPVKPPAFTRAEIQLRQWWIAEEKKDSVTLYYETFNPTLGLSCRFASPFTSSSLCRRTVSQSIPISSLSEIGIKVPSNATEAQILSRQLNNLVRLTRGGKPIDGTISLPSTITWHDY